MEKRRTELNRVVFSIFLRLWGRSLLGGDAVGRQAKLKDVLCGSPRRSLVDSWVRVTVGYGGAWVSCVEVVRGGLREVGDPSDQCQLPAAVCDQSVDVLPPVPQSVLDTLLYDTTGVLDTRSEGPG